MFESLASALFLVSMMNLLGVRPVLESLMGLIAGVPQGHLFPVRSIAGLHFFGVSYSGGYRQNQIERW